MRLLSFFLGLFAVPALFAQSEAALKSYFEGMYVVVKIDMPGDKSGIDVYPDRRPDIEFKKVGDRLRRHGTALRRGDAVMVTRVDVDKKNIEFHLAGGGYGAFGDMAGIAIPPVDSYVPKSNREKKLRAELAKTTDEKRRRELKDEIEDLSRARNREESVLRSEAAQIEVMAQAQEQSLRLSGGSRFNLWYDPGVPASALTPESVMAALAPYVEFAPDAAPVAEPKPTPILSDLRKGLSELEVEQMFGRPSERASEEGSAGFGVVRAVYDAAESRLTAHFVEGVLVRYVLEGK